MALSERHTRQQDGPRLGLLSRSQSMKHMKDRWLCVGSSGTRGMFPCICFATDEAKQQKLTLFSLFGARSLVYITGWWYWPWEEKLLVLTDGCHSYSMWLRFTHDPVFCLPKPTLFSQLGEDVHVFTWVKSEGWWEPFWIKICRGFQERQRYFLFDGRKLY